MSHSPSKAGRIIGMIILCGFAALLAWSFTRPAKTPASRRLIHAEQELQQITENSRERTDAQLVRQLLDEDLSDRSFSFPTIVLATSDRKVIPLDPERESHQRVIAAIEKALVESTAELSQPDSPVRELRRINEGSRFFEEALLEKINATAGLSCEIPSTREGERQRSGYPDLKVVDESSGDVFYLDPKLVEDSSWKSSFRSFYFEPKNQTLKINDHAVHLLVGIGHDGESGEWTFGETKIVDLSTLKVRLKAEFQASNADLYGADGKD
ncbi:hypothetical protein ACFQY0_08255 [Haloferula chungangensis]|uniref:Uncharacterized protein n=1 Tax=Haloferula chungangensis TaxID=1048331 RepID=A0ABW2L490_9BACT